MYALGPNRKAVLNQAILNSLGQIRAREQSNRASVLPPPLPRTSESELFYFNSFVEKLELSEATELLTRAAATLQTLSPASTSVLLYQSQNSPLMIINGPRDEDRGLKLQINSLRKKFFAEQSELRLLDKRSRQGKNLEQTSHPLYPLAHSGGTLYYFNNSPGFSTESYKNLLELCLRHLEKRLQEAEQWLKMKNAGLRDHLTGLFNRAHFDETLQREMERSSRYFHPTSLIMIDLDYFKKINDKFGHQAGDRVLAEVGSLLEEEVRSSDSACRYGGEEFAVILPETDKYEAARIADRLLVAIRKLKISVADKVNLKITASLGVASNTGNNGSQTCKAADDALYRAKESGRNQVKIG